jgi:hypothetical protein
MTTKTTKKPAAKKAAARKAPKAAAKPKINRRDDRARWLWPTFAALVEALVDAPARSGATPGDDWADPKIHNMARAVLMRFLEGQAGLRGWPADAGRLPAEPRWFNGWSVHLAHLQNEVDGLLPAWSRLQRDSRADLYLYQLEVPMDPTDVLTQVQRGRRAADLELAKNIQRLNLLRPLHVLPVLEGKRVHLVVDDGRRRRAALKAGNLEVLDDWWSDFRVGVRNSERPVLDPRFTVRVACELLHCSSARAVEIGAALNTARALDRPELVEEALRLKRAKCSVDEIANNLHLGRSQIFKLLAFESLQPELLGLVFDRAMPLEVGMLLASRPAGEQRPLWEALADKTNKLEALRQLLGATNRARPPLARRLQEVRARLKDARSPSALLLRDVLDALEDSADAHHRLPPELVAELGLVEPVATPTEPNNVRRAVTLKHAGASAEAVAAELQLTTKQAGKLMTLAALEPGLFELACAGRLPIEVAVLLAARAPAEQRSLWAEVEHEKNKLESLRRRLRQLELPIVDVDMCEVACPVCEADVGEPCDDGGHPHTIRTDLARKARELRPVIMGEATP